MKKSFFAAAGCFAAIVGILGAAEPAPPSKPADADGLKYYAPADAPMRLSGFPFYAADRVYRRLPLQPDRKLPDKVERLAWNTAGGQLAFRSDSKRIVLAVKLQYASVMYHMAQTGSAGFDLYTGVPGRRLFSGIAKFKAGSTEYTSEIFRNPEAKMREFLIDFPLYSGVESVFIGLDAGAKFEAPTPWTDDRPIVVYGSSITQGGCASRPGMVYTNILSRKLNRPVINLGFSGAGCGEPEVVDEVAKVENPALFVLDYEANTKDAATMRETMPYFIRAIRKRHPAAPILILTKIRYPREFIDTAPADQAPRSGKSLELREEQRRIAEEFTKADPNIHFFDGSGLLGEDWDEGTVDGVHPNDFGFYRMAKNLLPVLSGILDGRGGRD
jgi:lysophospholipase L1-like esterase